MSTYIPGRCYHRFTRGAKAGQFCNKKGNYPGGLCAAHKNTKSPDPNARTPAAVASGEIVTDEEQAEMIRELDEISKPVAKKPVAKKPVAKKPVDDLASMLGGYDELDEMFKPNPAVVKKANLETRKYEKLKELLIDDHIQYHNLDEFNQMSEEEQVEHITQLANEHYPEKLKAAGLKNLNLPKKEIIPMMTIVPGIIKPKVIAAPFKPRAKVSPEVRAQKLVGAGKVSQRGSQISQPAYKGEDILKKLDEAEANEIIWTDEDDAELERYCNKVKAKKRSKGLNMIQARVTALRKAQPEVREKKITKQMHDIITKIEQIECF